jgi:hypothetical protein
VIYIFFISSNKRQQITSTSNKYKEKRNASIRMIKRSTIETAVQTIKKEQVL